MILKKISIGWRNIRKNGIYSIINITGLSIGISVVMLILFWVADELNFDKFHKNLHRIYTVYEHQQYSDGHELYTKSTPFPLGQELSKTYPEIEHAVTYTTIGKYLIQHGDKAYKEGPVISAGSNFLNIFSYPVLAGDKNALASTDQIVITEELARLYFGNEPAIGKILKFNNEHPYTVGAVIATPQANSTLDFKVLVPIEFMKTRGADLSAWGNNWPTTQVLLAEGADAQSLDAKITNLCMENGQPNTTLHLFPFQNERLYSYSGKNDRIQYVYQFLAIALIIILIASINFINLSVTKAEQRRSEVGVRKVLGANRLDILKQFLIEKGMMIFFSLVLSGIIVLLLLPIFGAISGKNILIGHLQNMQMILMLLVTVIIVLLLSVAYPSLYLSSINAVLALKKAKNGKQNNLSLKSLLVVVQFVLAIVLISGAIIISHQMKYINTYDLGYDHSNLIYLSLEGDAKTKHEAIKQELSGISGIKAITRSDKLPFYGGNSSWGHDWEGKDPENKVLICKMNVDKNYLNTMGIKLVDGNYFPDFYDKVLSEGELSSPQVILNQEAVKRMGIDQPVGKYFSPWGDRKGAIVGVAEDFHFESLHSGVEPLILLPLVNDPEYIIARLSQENISQTINQIKSSWAKILPQSTCEVGFFDDQLAELYDAESKVSGLFMYFSFVAICISGIGLFGMSLFVIERRRKEVGIRKVNGAKIVEVMILLNKDFIMWVAIAFVIATPIAWYAMAQWLENFAYKTELSWWIFALAGLLALGIALLTVSWQSWKAATRNPVEALRYE